MLLTVDSVTVLGSRHGLLLDPIRKNVELIRFDPFEALVKVHLRAGLRIGTRELVFPFCDGTAFDFYDQRSTPCSVSFTAIDPASGVKVKISFVTPFRPRDGEFSSTPVLAVRMEAERLNGQFRWEKATEAPQQVELFFEVEGEAVETQLFGNDAVELRFVSQAGYVREGEDGKLADRESRAVTQIDRLVALQGRVREKEFNRMVTFDGTPQPLTIAWCTHSEPVFQLHHDYLPFRYTARFPDLEAVVQWARSNPEAIIENGRRVDAIVAQNNCGNAVNHLLAFTLHTWLANTWWLRNQGLDWFSVWEGNCYFHSTVDVEFTQAPFYLSVWPELLRLQLAEWPAYAKDGTLALGEIGEGTRFLSHDMGSHASAGRQHYPHDMEVEETANFILLSFAYWRRTGDASLIQEQNRTLVDFLWFLIRADTTGNGVPNIGVANTIDDGSPAIQFGSEQVYLAIKTLAALRTGIEILQTLNHEKLAAKCRSQADILTHTILEKGWQKDHFGVLVEKAGRLKDPWTGEEKDYPEIPGWDAPHIYASNALPVLDMVGFDIGLPRQILQRDLEIGAERCLRHYGCVHTDFTPKEISLTNKTAGLAGASLSPGWISMNLSRDIAAFYREIDLRYLADGYWDWQLTTNTQQPSLFFETFGGNQLKFYPRGIAIWGYFDALGGIVVDQVRDYAEAQASFPGVRVPFLLNADWIEGNVTPIIGLVVSNQN